MREKQFNNTYKEKEVGEEQIKEVELDTPHPDEGNTHIKAEEIAYKNKDSIYE